MTLDNPNQASDPKSVSPWPTAFRYALIGSLILIVINLVFHMTNMIDFTGQSSNIVPNIINWGAMIAIWYLAVQNHKNQELGGYISYGRVIILGLLMGLVIGVILGIWNFVFFSFIETDFFDTVMNQMQAQFEDQGMDDDQMEAALGVTKMFMTPTFFALISIPIQAISMLIISLIGGFFVKKDPPEGLD